MDAAFKSAGVKVIDGALPVRASLWRAAQLIQRTVRIERPALVHSTLFRSDIAARLASTSVPLVSSLVNDCYSKIRYQALDDLGRLKLLSVQAIDAATATMSNCYISNSMASTAANSASLNIPLSRIRTIYRGRDLSRFRPRQDDEQSALKLSAGLAGRFVVLNVARMLPRKGHADLLNAFAVLYRERPSASLVLVGDGPERLRLEALAATLGVARDVHFLGLRDDVDVLLRAADVFAFPSHFEGFPGAVIEAMASGLPTVASDIDAHVEAIRHGDNGLIFAVGSSTSLGAALCRLSVSVSMRETFGAAARRTACAMFDIGHSAKRYRDLYEELAT